MDLVLKYNTLK
ncbi:TPA: hypothetical protein PBD92_000939 [Staphylococcus aureus]|nr:hypothetical protein [Staphylococcus aureus]HDD2683733.1 hypothetical protein [Staphylococcus aureus]HDD3086253.1 hypothetical protein [Staphylococcus aureus]HDD3538029.1 hypothetical protein [Staphylococcus aureus]HDD5649510.1 hypothetical protein [Staphylococcus aureus]